MPGAVSRDVFIVTSRAEDDDPALLYSSRRASELGLARVTVSIPPNHRPGKIERPSHLPPDPAKDFTIADPVRFGTRDGFVKFAFVFGGSMASCTGLGMAI